MVYNVDAIYEQGVFRPVDPVSVPAGARVHLRVEEERNVTDGLGSHVAEYLKWLDQVSGSWRGDFTEVEEGEFEARESLS